MKKTGWLANFDVLWWTILLSYCHCSVHTTYVSVMRTTVWQLRTRKRRKSNTNRLRTPVTSITGGRRNLLLQKSFKLGSCIFHVLSFSARQFQVLHCNQSTQQGLGVIMFGHKRDLDLEPQLLLKLRTAQYDVSQKYIIIIMISGDSSGGSD